MTSDQADAVIAGLAQLHTDYVAMQAYNQVALGWLFLAACTVVFFGGLSALLLIPRESRL